MEASNLNEYKMLCKPLNEDEIRKPLDQYETCKHLNKYKIIYKYLNKYDMEAFKCLDINCLKHHLKAS